MWVRTLGGVDTLEEEMATHSSILIWEIPWTEDSGGGCRGASECVCMCVADGKYSIILCKMIACDAVTFISE